MEFGTFFSVGKLSLRKSENGLYEIVGEDFVNHFLIISSLPGNSKHLTKSPSFMLHFGGGVNLQQNRGASSTKKHMFNLFI